MSLPEEMRQLVERCRRRCAGLHSYQGVLEVRERHGRELGPADRIAIKVRKSPWSVHMKWIAGRKRKREVLYVRGANGGDQFALMGDWLLPVLFKLRPDHPMVARYSRRRITEAGLSGLIDRLAKVVENPDAALYGTFRYVGLSQAPDGRRVHQLDQKPVEGGTRTWTIDESWSLLVGVATRDDNARLLSSYRYMDLCFDVRLTDADFDPARLWPKRRPLSVTRSVRPGVWPTARLAADVSNRSFRQGDSTPTPG